MLVSGASICKLSVKSLQFTAQKHLHKFSPMQVMCQLHKASLGVNYPISPTPDIMQVQLLSQAACLGYLYVKAHQEIWQDAWP